MLAESGLGALSLFVGVPAFRQVTGGWRPRWRFNLASASVLKWRGTARRCSAGTVSGAHIQSRRERLGHSRYLDIQIDGVVGAKQIRCARCAGPDCGEDLKVHGIHDSGGNLNRPARRRHYYCGRGRCRIAEQKSHATPLGPTPKGALQRAASPTAASRTIAKVARVSRLLNIGSEWILPGCIRALRV